jgi:hypothetical protein
MRPGGAGLPAWLASCTATSQSQRGQMLRFPTRTASPVRQVLVSGGALGKDQCQRSGPDHHDDLRRAGQPSRYAIWRASSLPARNTSISVGQDLACRRPAGAGPPSHIVPRSWEPARSRSPGSRSRRARTVPPYGCGCHAILGVGLRILVRASSAVSSAVGRLWRYFSVVEMLAWPSRSLTTCRSAPPARSHEACACLRS